LRQANHAKRQRRRALIHETAEEGAPGHPFAPVLAALLDKLNEGDGRRLHHDVGRDAASSPMFLVPAYFRLLQHLTTQPAPFLLTIRTFGSDSANVIAEHNAYVNGLHRHFKPPAGVDAAPLLIRPPLDTGRITRTGVSPADTRLAMVHAVSVTSPYRPSALAAAAAGPGDVASPPAKHDYALMCDVVSGYKGIYDWLHDRIPAAPERGAEVSGEAGTAAGATKPVAGKVIALRDDYEWWFSHAEQGPYGKLLPLNKADGDTFQIFLDDNIAETADQLRILHRHHCDPALHAFFDFDEEVGGEGAAGAADDSPPTPAARDTDSAIVDARDVATGEHIPFAQVGNVNMVRVDPISTILNPDYLVELVRRCEARWMRDTAAAAAAATPKSKNAAV